MTPRPPPRRAGPRDDELVTLLRRLGFELSVADVQGWAVSDREAVESWAPDAYQCSTDVTDWWCGPAPEVLKPYATITARDWFDGEPR